MVRRELQSAFSISHAMKRRMNRVMTSSFMPGKEVWCEVWCVRMFAMHTLSFGEAIRYIHPGMSFRGRYV